MSLDCFYLLSAAEIKRYEKVCKTGWFTTVLITLRASKPLCQIGVDEVARGPTLPWPPFIKHETASMI